MARLPRIRVSQIALPHLMHGWSAEELGRQYPHLTMSEIHSALSYYFDHAEEINRKIEAEMGEDERLRAQAAGSPFMMRLRAREKR